VETVVPGQTGLLFGELTAAGLRAALDNFRSMKFNKNVLRSRSTEFSRAAFKQKIAASIEQKWAEFKANR
jgi:hypothetical protein